VQPQTAPWNVFERLYPADKPDLFALYMGRQKQSFTHNDITRLNWHNDIVLLRQTWFKLQQFEQVIVHNNKNV